MKITDIVKSKSTRYTIYVDDEYWYILDIEIIAQNHLKVGDEIDEETLDTIKSQAERRKGRERAYYLLGYRDHSQKELYDKLLKSVREEIAAEIVALVTEQGLVDDEKYALKLAHYYLEKKKWGAKKAVYEMQKKGIGKEMALNAISECDTNSVEQITAVIDKKYYRYLSDDIDGKGKQKVIAGLMRLGYSYSDIKIAIDEYK